MFIIHSYTLSVIFCIVTMLCRDSWANALNLTQESWRFELFYWDYVIGIILTSLVFSFTFESTGKLGRSFIEEHGKHTCL